MLNAFGMLNILKKEEKKNIHQFASGSFLFSLSFSLYPSLSFRLPSVSYPTLFIYIVKPSRTPILSRLCCTKATAFAIGWERRIYFLNENKCFVEPHIIFITVFVVEKKNEPKTWHPAYQHAINIFPFDVWQCFDRHSCFFFFSFFRSISLQFLDYIFLYICNGICKNRTQI